MRTSAPLLLALFFLDACGSRTDLSSIGAQGGGAPVGAGGQSGGAGIGGIGGTGTGGTGTGGTGTGGTGAGGTGTGGTGTGGTGTGGTGTGGAGGSAPPDAGTCPQPIQSARTSFDLYFLVDKSASMGTVDPPNVLTDTRWVLLERAFNRFVVDSVTSFRLGIGFFPLMPPGSGRAPLCTAADYVTPAVGIRGPIVDQSLAMAIAAQMVGYDDPTTPALEGALIYTSKWAVGGAGSGPVPALIPPAVVLITDGGPAACGSTVESGAAVAAAGFKAVPRIQTYVFGLSSLGSAGSAIALAGGTYRVISASTGGVIPPPMLTTPPSGAEIELDLGFQKIARSRTLCNLPFDKPLLGSADVSRLQVRTSLKGPAGLTLSTKVANVESCGANGGWFLEPPAMPTMIMLCPSTCAAVVDATDGRVAAELPCVSAAPSTALE